MRGGSTLRLHSKLIVILTLSIAATLDASLFGRRQHGATDDESDPRSGRRAPPELQFQMMKLLDARGHIPPDAYGRAKAHVDRLRANARVQAVELAASPQISGDM